MIGAAPGAEVHGIRKYEKNQEKELLKKHYAEAKRSELLELLPNRSWIGIRTIASELKLRRHRDDSEDMFHPDICLLDFTAIQAYGLSAGVNYVRSSR